MEKLYWESTSEGGAYASIDIAEKASIVVYLGKIKNMFDFKLSLTTRKDFGIESTQRDSFKIFESEVLYTSLEGAKTQALYALAAHFSSITKIIAEEADA